MPSTPGDYSQAIVRAVKDFCADQKQRGSDIAEIVHATTVATNAILERSGARTALITTTGFRDVLELRRIRIPLSYDFEWQKPAPLVERALRFEVKERIDAKGSVRLPLDPASLEPIIATLKDDPVEAIAVCFLHSYRHPQHERLVGAVLRKCFPDVYVSLSCEVLPEIQEFERTSTTVVNAYVAPLISTYLQLLRKRLLELEVEAPVLVMQSNGGLITAAAASQRPVTIIESGPAAGVVAAARLARDCGYANVITFDMGGTTTKASIIERGEILRGAEYEVGSSISVSSRLARGSGYLLRIPVIDISEVGAGGGSIAALDHGGALRVGPRSAGAVPGPAAYGRGNDRPTVTDANLVLGYLSANSLAGGSLPIEGGLAAKAIEKHIALPARLSLEDAAHGIHLVANSNMVRAIKSVSVERGRDPADFVLLAFGGAGPIHAAGIARALGISHVVVPPGPGVFSAYGLLRSEVEHHAARTILADTADIDIDAVQGIIDDMFDELIQRALVEGFERDAISVKASADLRYRGQSSEITVPFELCKITHEAIRVAEAQFEEEFEKEFAHRGEVKRFELAAFRLVLSIARLER